MNGNNIVLDSNILIYLLNGDNTIESLLEGKSIFLSFVTEVKLKSYKNLTKREVETINTLLGFCQIIHSNDSIVAQTVEFRKKYKLKTPDALILATAQHLKLPSVTADKRLQVPTEVEIIGYGRDL